MKDFNKFALITGAAGLLGYYHAKALLDLNYNLILTDINMNLLNSLKLNLEQKFKKNKILIHKMDVSSKSSVTKIVNILKKKKIKLKVLVNNAAIDSKVKKKN